MSWVPDGYRATRWGAVPTGQVEVWLLSQGTTPRSRGVVRDGGATLEGAAAFRAAVAASGTRDPLALARLASVLADRGTREVHGPWTPSAPGAKGPQGAQGPRLDGDVVEYWRRGDGTDLMYRVRVGLDGVVREVVSSKDLAGPPADPVAALRAGLASAEPDAQVAAVTAFVKANPPTLGPELAALTRHPSFLVRQAAVDGLALRCPPETGPALLAVLLNDPHGDVRVAASRWLAAHPDPAWIPQLEPKASDPDVSEVLRAARAASRPPPGGCN